MSAFVMRYSGNQKGGQMLKRIILFGFIAILSLSFIGCATFRMKTPEPLKGLNFTTREQLLAMEEYPEFYFEIGPAQYLITKAERKVWKKIKKIEDLELRNSTQKEFLKWFWEIRDPFSSTPINEFKEQVYFNVAYVQRNFRQENFHQGYLSDRGKIFLILGAPDFAGGGSSPGYAQEKLEEEEPNLFGSGDRTSEILIWHYNKLEYFGGTYLSLHFQYPQGICFRKGFIGGWQQAVSVFHQEYRDIVYYPVTDFRASEYRTNLERFLESIREMYIVNKNSKFVVPNAS